MFNSYPLFSGDTRFIINTTIVKSGAISFSYKVIAEGTNGGFQFFKDGQSLYSELVKTSGHRYLTKMVLLEPGEHVLVFLFEGGSLTSVNSRGNYVAIDKIEVIFCCCFILLFTYNTNN